jgi:hypothetical protein
MFFAFLCMTGLYYHIAFLLLLVGVIVAQRNGGLPWTRPAGLAGAVAILTVVHGLLLQNAGAGAFRKIVGIMVGRPSIWPYLVAADYSPVAVVIALVALGLAIWRLALRQSVPDYWLFFLVCVWVPLFALGLTGWYFPPRYTEFALLPLVLVSLAVAQHYVQTSIGEASLAKSKLGANIAPIVCAIAIVNPFAMAHAVNPGASFPDHKGAAEYMRSIKFDPKDIVLAEEVLLQTYYLGHVDYWLVNRNVAANFVERWNGKIVDQYTHTPVIGSGEELRALLERPDRGAIYVIGSGEEQKDARRFMRGDEISSLLQSDEFKVVYLAPDKLTKVWKVDAPGGVK